MKKRFWKRLLSAFTAVTLTASTFAAFSLPASAADGDATVHTASTVWQLCASDSGMKTKHSTASKTKIVTDTGDIETTKEEGSYFGAFYQFNAVTAPAGYGIKKVTLTVPQGSTTWSGRTFDAYYTENPANTQTDTSVFAVVGAAVADTSSKIGTMTTDTADANNRFVTIDVTNFFTEGQSNSYFLSNTLATDGNRKLRADAKLNVEYYQITTSGASTATLSSAWQLRATTDAWTAKNNVSNKAIESAGAIEMSHKESTFFGAFFLFDPVKPEEGKVVKRALLTVNKTDSFKKLDFSTYHVGIPATITAEADVFAAVSSVGISESSSAYIGKANDKTGTEDANPPLIIDVTSKFNTGRPNAYFLFKDEVNENYKRQLKGDATLTLTYAYETPEIAVDYTNKKLTGFVEGGSYTINGNDVAPTSGKLAIDDSWYGTELNIVRKAEGDTEASDAQTLTVGVALIGTTGYKTLAEAVTAASSAETETITLLTDTNTSSIRLTVNKSVTITSGNKTVTVKNDEDTGGFLVNNGTSTTLNNVNVTTTDGKGKAVAVESKILNINNGTITGNAYINKNGAQLNLDGTTVTGNIVWGNQETVNISFTNNTDIKGTVTVTPNSTVYTADFTAKIGTLTVAGESITDGTVVINKTGSNDLAPSQVTTLTNDGYELYTDTNGNLAIKKSATPLTSITLDNKTGIKIGDTLTATVEPNGATLDYVWSRSSDGESWSEITGETGSSYTVKADDYDYYIKVTATGTGSYSRDVSDKTTDKVIKIKEALPTGLAINYADETITGLAASTAYIINGTEITTGADQTTISVTSYIPTDEESVDVTVVKKATDDDHANSDAATVSVPKRLDAPTGMGTTNVTASGRSDGTITNVTTAMQYKKSSDDAWTEVTDTTITGLTAGDYVLRYKATVSAFASVASEIVTVSTEGKKIITWDVDGTQSTAEYELGDTPSFGGSTEKAQDNKYTYTFTGWNPEITAVTGDQTYTAQYSKTARSYNINYTENGGTFGSTPSATYTYSATDAVTLPTNITKSGYTFAGWYEDGTKVTAIAADTTGDKTFAAHWKANTPSISVDYVNEKLTGFTAINTYIISATGLEDETVTNKTETAIASYIGKEISVVQKAKETYEEDSTAQTITVPPRPDAPTPQGEAPESSSANGTITDVDNTMEYVSKTAYDENNPTAWTAIDGITVSVTPGKYYVRVAAKASESFASLPATVNVPDYNVQTFDVIWKVGDDTFKTDSNVTEGTTVNAPDPSPTKEPTTEKTFTFAGWYTDESTKAIVNLTNGYTVNADTTFFAKFTEAPRKYTVTWKAADGSTLKTDEVEYNKTASLGTDVPLKEATDGKIYVFRRWSPAASTKITADQTFEPLYNEMTIPDSSEGCIVTALTSAQLRATDGNWTEAHSKSNKLVTGNNDIEMTYGTAYFGAYYSFDAIEVPEGKMIDTATLTLYEGGDGYTNRSFTVYKAGTPDDEITTDSDVKTKIFPKVTEAKATEAIGNTTYVAPGTSETASGIVTIDVTSVFTENTKNSYFAINSLKDKNSTDLTAEGNRPLRAGATLTIIYKDAVAKIGDKYYATFADALSTANDNDEIVLLKDIDLSSDSDRTTISKTLTISADTAKTIKVADKRPAGILVNSGKTVTFNKINIEAKDTATYPAIGTSGNNSKLNISDASVTGDIYQESGTGNAITLNNVTLTGTLKTRKGAETTANSTACTITLTGNTNVANVIFCKGVDTLKMDADASVDTLNVVYADGTAASDDVVITKADSALTAAKVTTLQINGSSTDFSLAANSDGNIVLSKALEKLPAPTISVASYTDETLGTFVNGGTYKVSVDSGAYADVTLNGTTVKIDGAWFGNSVQFKRIGDNSTTADSDPSTEFAIPARPAAPSDITTESATSGQNDGKIKGLDAEKNYEYIASDAAANTPWTTVTGKTEIDSLATGTYNIRYAATNSAFASNSVPVTVNTQGTWTVTFVDGNGITLKTTTVNDGAAAPAYDGETPTKTATAQYSYTFDGTWTRNPEGETITADTTFTANFTEVPNEPEDPNTKTASVSAQLRASDSTWATKHSTAASTKFVTGTDTIEMTAANNFGAFYYFEPVTVPDGKLIKSVTLTVNRAGDFKNIYYNVYHTDNPDDKTVIDKIFALVKPAIDDDSTLIGTTKDGVAAEGSNYGTVTLDITSGFTPGQANSYFLNNSKSSDSGKRPIQANATIKIEYTDAIATITKDGVTTSYATLAAAIAGATEGDTITLLDDVETDRIIIGNTSDASANKFNTNNLTIDGNGHSITLSSNKNCLFEISGNKNLTLKNMTINGNSQGSFIYTINATTTGTVSLINVKAPATNDKPGVRLGNNVSITADNKTTIAKLMFAAIPENLPAVIVNKAAGSEADLAVSQITSIVNSSGEALSEQELYADNGNLALKEKGSEPEKPEITGITVTPYTATYDKAEHNAVTVSGTEEGDTITYTLDSGSEQNTVPQITDVKDYTIKVKVERENYKPYETTVTAKITKADITGVTVTGYTGVADGQPHGVTVIGKLEGDTVTYTYDDKTEVTEEPSYTTVGTHEVTVKIHRDSNYSDFTETVTVQITDKPVIDYITVTPNSGTYTGEPVEAVTVTGATTNDTVAYKLDDGEYTSEVPTVTEKGEYEVTVKVTRDGYSDFVKVVTVTISEPRDNFNTDFTPDEIKGVNEYAEATPLNGWFSNDEESNDTAVNSVKTEDGQLIMTNGDAEANLWIGKSYATQEQAEEAAKIILKFRYTPGSTDSRIYLASASATDITGGLDSDTVEGAYKTAADLGMTSDKTYDVVVTIDNSKHEAVFTVTEKAEISPMSVTLMAYVDLTADVPDDTNTVIFRPAASATDKLDYFSAELLSEVKTELKIGDITQSENKTTVAVSVENPTDETNAGIMMAALYGKDRVLKQVKEVSGNTVEFDNATEGYVKLFLWTALSGENAMEPILPSTEKAISAN